MITHKPTGLSFKTKPWKHQLEALKYLMPREYGALYTDMGSGKTKIMIDLIVNRGFKRILLVATSKICKRKVWDNEILEHAEDELFCVINLSGVRGNNRPTYISSKLAEGKSAHEILIVNYESIWREPLKKYLLKKFKPDCIICDESHKIKGQGSKVSRCLTLLGRHTPNRFLMTGTPMGQSPLDIYAQYRFLAPQIFGTRFNDFKYQYANWVQISGGYEVKDKKNPYKNLDELHEKMFSCAFTCEVDQKLPSTKDIVVEFDMSPKAQKYYKELQKEGVLELKTGVVDAGNVLAVMTRLQQLTSGYLPTEDEDGNKTILQVDDSRREAFREILESIPEHEPVVVFAKYTKDIKNIRKIAKELGRKSSELSGRKDTMDKWLAGKTTVLAMQISSGAEGLNDMVKARYCIYYSLHHSLLKYKQSRKRIHRPKQTRPCVYYILVAKMSKGKTIDEKIVESLKNNQEIINQIMENRDI